MLKCRWLNYGINLPKLIKIRIMLTTNAGNDINLKWSSRKVLWSGHIYTQWRDAFNCFFGW